jgi:hypothetical protein
LLLLLTQSTTLTPPLPPTPQAASGWGTTTCARSARCRRNRSSCCARWASWAVRTAAPCHRTAVPQQGLCRSCCGAKEQASRGGCACLRRLAWGASITHRSFSQIPLSLSLSLSLLPPIAGELLNNRGMKVRSAAATPGGSRGTPGGRAGLMSPAGSAASSRKRWACPSALLAVVAFEAALRGLPGMLMRLSLRLENCLCCGLVFYPAAYCSVCLGLPTTACPACPPPPHTNTSLPPSTTLPQRQPAQWRQRGQQRAAQPRGAPGPAQGGLHPAVPPGAVGGTLRVQGGRACQCLRGMQHFSCAAFAAVRQCGSVAAAHTVPHSTTRQHARTHLLRPPTRAPCRPSSANTHAASCPPLHPHSQPSFHTLTHPPSTQQHSHAHMLALPPPPLTPPPSHPSTQQHSHTHACTPPPNAHRTQHTHTRLHSSPPPPPGGPGAVHRH